MASNSRTSSMDMFDRRGIHIRVDVVKESALVYLAICSIDDVLASLGRFVFELFSDHCSKINNQREL